MSASAKSNQKRNPTTKPLSKEIDTSHFQKFNESLAENKQLESELHLTLEEIAHLQNALADAKMKLTAYQNQARISDITPDPDLNSISETLKEINLPLMNINNYCELLLSQSVGILGTLQCKFIERINNSANQIRQLLNEFHSTNAVSAHLQDENENLVLLQPIIEQILSQNSDLLKEKQLILQLEEPKYLPRVLGSFEEIEKIISVTITNALSVTPDSGAVNISLQLDNRPVSPSILFKVKDSGPGIPEEYLQNLFSIQNHSNSSKIPGLAITHPEIVLLSSLVEDQMGTINVKNDIEFGCIFEITFVASKS